MIRTVSVQFASASPLLHRGIGYASPSIVGIRIIELQTAVETPFGTIPSCITSFHLWVFFLTLGSKT